MNYYKKYIKYKNKYLSVKHKLYNKSMSLLQHGGKLEEIKKNIYIYMLYKRK